jgi:hypothetical protein
MWKSFPEDDVEILKPTIWKKLQVEETKYITNITIIIDLQGW